MAYLIRAKDDYVKRFLREEKPDADKFSMNALKELYCLRWNEEISFRELKHIIGAVDFHSKIVEYVNHELWARLLFYNFSSQITALAVISQKERKHAYQVNFTMAYLTCQEFLRRNCNESFPIN